MKDACDCHSMKNAPVLPATVNQMMYAFYDCYNLTGDIYIQSPNINSANYSFYNTTLTKNVYIPFNAPVTLYGWDAGTVPSGYPSRVWTDVNPVPSGTKLLDQNGNATGYTSYGSGTSSYFYVSSSTRYKYNRNSSADLQGIGKTATYKALTTAGYKEDGSVCGVYLKDISSLEIDDTQYITTVSDPGTGGIANVTYLNKYIGTNGVVDTPIGMKQG